MSWTTDKPMRSGWYRPKPDAPVVLSVLVSVMFVLAGCTSDAVHLRHSHTGNTVQCGPYEDTGMTAELAANKRDRCIQDYERKGYERVKEFGASPAVVR